MHKMNSLALRMALLAAGFVAEFSALAADLVVRDWESPLEDGSTVVGDGFIYSSPFSMGLLKIGDGSWTLPLDRLMTHDAVKVDVRSGKLVLSDAGTRPSVATPPTTLNSALFWVSADKNVVADGTAVSAWYDVRESKSDDVWGTSYPSAVAVQPSWKSGDMAYPELQSVDGLNMIWFGGSPTAGVTMGFRSAADRSVAQTLSSIREVFVVVRFTSGFGNVIGSKSGSTQYFLSGSPGSMNGNYLSVAASLLVPSGVNHRNGILFDPVGTRVQTGTQLLGYHHPSSAAVTADYFFNDREKENDAGGEYLCEAVFFTKELSLEERAAIETYLMGKWGIEPALPRTDVRIAKNAEVEVGSLPGGLKASGDGVLVFKNADAGARLNCWRDNAFRGTVNVAAGSLNVGASALDVAACSGVTMTALNTVQGGDYVVSAGVNGEAGCVKASVVDSWDKAGGTVRLGDVPTSVTNIAIQAAVVSLSAPRELPDNATIDPFPAAGSATFDDPGFESQAAASKSIGEDGTVGGWTFTGISNANVYFYQSKGWYCDYAPPEGKVAMGIKMNKADGRVTASTVVHVHTNGVYELSFMTCSRRASESPSRVYADLSLKRKSDGTIFHLGGVICYPLFGYSARRYRTPALEAGDYELILAATTKGDSLGWFDDFKMRLAPDADRTEVVTVPYGGFENVTFAYRNAMDEIHSDNLIQGWTFALGTGRGVLNSGCPAVAFATVGMSHSWAYNAGSSRYGNTQLTFWDGDGVATSDSFTTLPAGVWRLRCRACRWGNSDWWPGKGNSYLTAGVAPTFAASVTVNGVEQQLGTISPSERLFAAKTFPGTVQVAAGDSVSVILKQTTENAAGQLDDLEFVRADDVNLVSDDGFETGSAWTLAANDTEATKGAAERHAYSTMPYQFGLNVCSGSYALRLVDLGSAEQEIAFPESGVYRLSFWARARVEETQGYPGKYRHGGNRIRASLVDGEEEETEILLTDSLYCTNFVEYTALFRVPEETEKPIRRTLRLAGINDGVSVKPGKLGWHNDLTVMIDDVTVYKAPKTTLQLPAELNLALSKGATLNLDFDGQSQVESVMIGSRRLTGVISAERYPQYVTGIGSLYAPAKGLSIIIR